MYGMSAQERESYSSPEGVQMLELAVAEIVGQEFLLVPQAEQGLTTLVYGCETPDGSYIARRGKNENAFRKDEYAAELFGSSQLLIPEVRGIVSLDDSSLVCVTTRAPGNITDEAKLFTRGTVLNQALADTLRVMHSNASSPEHTGITNLFGPIQRHLATASYAKVGKEWPRNLTQPTLEEIAAIQQHLARFTMTSLRVLCHGDIKGPNLLAKDDKITGVIDWAMAEFGDPASDFGRLYEPYPQALDYGNYRLPGKAAEHLRERILYYAMATCVGSVRFFGGLHDETQVAHAENRLIELANEATSG